jgi:hypothetical protein
LLTFGVNPGAGYRINSWLAVGAGFSVLCATLDQKAAINSQLTDPGFGDGQLKIEDDDVA